MSVFSENLRKWRDIMRLTDAEIARRAGLSSSRYAHYVAGDREPDTATIARISQSIGVTPNVLLGVTASDAASPDLSRALAALEALGPEDLPLAGDILETMVVRAAKRRDGED